MKILKYLHVVFIISIIGCSERQPQFAYDLESRIAEKYRPEFHFTPPEKWMNDPNGMVYYEGEYHLFYQHYPDSTVWGPMHWGHAVSEDMIHWEHLPIALYPDENGYIFSGSAVVDWKNTSGLGSVEEPAIVAVFTYHDPERTTAGNIDYQTQGIAFSTDKGRSWTKYEGNPVLVNPGIKDFRDPKVAWNEAAEKWIMTLAVLDHIRFYSSPNLIDWKLESEFGKEIGDHGGVWECPDLFKLPIEGTDDEKWILLVSINPGAPNGGSGTQYFIGDFDGRTFTLEPTFLTDSVKSVWIDYGTDNYAGVTWSDIPEEDGRRIFMGWMSNWQYANVVPTETWRSAMTIPRTLQLRKRDDRFILASMPVKELNSVRGETIELDNTSIEGKSTIVKSDHVTYELMIDLDISQSDGFELIFSNEKDQKVSLQLFKSAGQVYFDRRESGIKGFEEGFAKIHYAPYRAGDNLSVQIIVDVTSMEVFLDDGNLVMTEIFFPDDGYNTIELVSKDGILNMTLGKITELKSIW